MRNIDDEIKMWEEIFRKEKEIYDRLSPSLKTNVELETWHEAISHLHTAQSNIDKLHKQKRSDYLDALNDIFKKNMAESNQPTNHP